ncbi:MAG: hypothetical protein IK009_02480 [Bacteroidales bacterium]|nr:hypothetical protein [Bacteroidales bacterium]
MKRFTAISITLCVLSLTAFAQWMPQKDSDEARKQGADRINAAKVAFFTQQLDLTVDEAQKFWPVYNEYNKEVDAARDELRKANMIMNNPEKKADELRAALKSYSDSQKKEAQLTEQYINKLLKILPVEKVAKVFTAEEMFRMQLLYQFRQGAPGAPAAPGNNPGGNQNNNQNGGRRWAPWQQQQQSQPQSSK